MAMVDTAATTTRVCTAAVDTVDMEATEGLAIHTWN